MIIDLDKQEMDLLEEIALKNSLVAEQYATNIIKSWLQSQLRGKYIQYVKTASIIDLVAKIGAAADAK